MLILKLTKTPPVSDGDYLIKANRWVLTDCSAEGTECDKVVWRFTQIGKGTLTTNGGQNNYDFSWAIDGDKLTVATDWLYELRNEYTYVLDRENNSLTLTDEKGERVLTGNFDETVPAIDVETNVDDQINDDTSVNDAIDVDKTE